MHGYEEKKVYGEGSIYCYATGDLGDVAYIESQKYEDCCIEYIGADNILKKEKDILSFNVYKFELFDSDGNKCKTDKPINMNIKNEENDYKIYEFDFYGTKELNEIEYEQIDILTTSFKCRNNYLYVLAKTVTEEK